MRAQIKENIKAPRHWGPGTGEFPAQMASNAENVSIWWRHHVNIKISDGQIGLSQVILLLNQQMITSGTPVVN